MNKLILITVVILFMTIISCKDRTKPIVINTNGVTLVIPGYFSEEDDLATDAIIQYANRYRNFYIAGFSLPTNISKDSAFRQAITRIKTSLADFKMDSIKITENSLETKIIGHFKEEPEAIYYHTKLVEKNNKRFLLTVWIRSEKRNKTYEADISSILKSFCN